MCGRERKREEGGGGRGRREDKLWGGDEGWGGGEKGEVKRERRGVYS